MKYPEYNETEIKIMILINHLEMEQRRTGISMNGMIKALIEILKFERRRDALSWMSEENRQSIPSEGQPKGFR